LNITQLILVIIYWCFGTSYWSSIPVSSSPFFLDWCPRRKRESSHNWSFSLTYASDKRLFQIHLKCFLGQYLADTLILRAIN